MCLELGMRGTNLSECVVVRFWNLLDGLGVSMRLID